MIRTTPYMTLKAMGRPVLCKVELLNIFRRRPFVAGHLPVLVFWFSSRLSVLYWYAFVNILPCFHGLDRHANERKNPQTAGQPLVSGFIWLAVLQLYNWYMNVCQKWTTNTGLPFFWVKLRLYQNRLMIYIWVIIFSLFCLACFGKAKINFAQNNVG